MSKIEFGKKKVAIIIPVYNMERYLDRCIKSVLDQTYELFTIYLVNDGSTDKSEKKCKEWAKQCSKVHYLKKQNGGLSSARNFGLDAIHEHIDYVMFIDPDDYIEKNFLEKSIYFMRGYDFVIASYTRVNEKYEEIGKCEFAEKKYIFNNDSERYDFIINKLLTYSVGWEVWGKLFDYAIVKKNNLRFSIKREFYEDLLYTLQYLSYCSGVIVLRDRLYNYLIRDNSMNASEKNKYDCVNEMSKEFYQFICDKMEPAIFAKMHSYIVYNEVLRNRGRFDKLHIEDVDFFVRNIRIYLAEPSSTERDLSIKKVLIFILNSYL